MRPSEGKLPGVEVGFTPRVMWHLPLQLSPAEISARASGPSGNGSVWRWRRRQCRAPGPHTLARQIRILWIVGQAAARSCLHSRRPAPGPGGRWAGRSGRPGWKGGEGQRNSLGSGLPPLPPPGRGLSLGVARGGASGGGGGRPVRKAWRKAGEENARPCCPVLEFDICQMYQIKYILCTFQVKKDARGLIYLLLHLA